MADEKHGTLLLNRNENISPDHTAWIKEQFNKGSIISAHGREVWIKAPGRNLSRIVNIPDRNSLNYKASWVNVYNLCLDYLEGMINSACLENKFIQRMGNVWTLNGHVVIWPRFNSQNADYARGLEKILEEYAYVKGKYIQSLNKDSGIRIKKSSVSLIPKQSVEVPVSPVKLAPKPVVNRPVKVEVKPKNIPQAKVQVKKTIKPIVKQEIKPEIKKAETVKTPVTVIPKATKSLKIQKISDGDTLNNRDYAKLKEDSPDIILLTCMNVLNTKEEDIFLTNARNCLKEGLKTGAFIYGHAYDEHEGASELKILLKILSNFNKDFSGLIFYSVDDDYIKQNMDDENKILNYINVYNAIMTTLKRAGYIAMISMSLESGKIIHDIMSKRNMESEHNIIYMVVVRDAGELKEGMPRIVVDPWNDYDMVILNNADLENNLRQRLYLV